MKASEIRDATSATDPGVVAPKVIEGFFFANGAEPTEFRFDTPVPKVEVRAGWEAAYRDMYQQNARRLVEALLTAAPGGLVDAIFAELARRKASVFCVPFGAGHGR